MKLNFGHGVLIFILLFMAGILTLVYNCTKQRIDLVSRNYYEQELKYEKQIAKEKQSLGLKEDVKIFYDVNNHQVSIQYPTMEEFKNIDGIVTFYKPDNAKLDFSLPVTTDDKNLQLVETSKLTSGRWNIQVNWEANGIDYYTENKILIGN